MPDPFGILPLPLPILILNSISDLGTLHYLLQASPAASVLFSKHYREITESILTNYVPQIQRLLRIVTSIRSQPTFVRAQCASLAEFRAFFATHIQAREAGDRSLREDGVVTLAAARSLARSATQAQGLATAFLRTHLEEYNQIKPCLKTVDLRKRLSEGETIPTEFAKYKVQDIWEPSWVEEQRVIRALWRVVIYLELREAARSLAEGQAVVWEGILWNGYEAVWESKSGGSWMPDEEHYLPHHEGQELEQVHDFLTNIAGDIKTPGSSRANLQSLPSVEPCPPIIPKPIPPFTLVARQLWQLTDHLARPSPGYQFFLLFQLDGETNWVMHGEWLTLFESLGLAFWDGQKLARLGYIAYDTPQGIVRVRKLRNGKAPKPVRRLSDLAQWIQGSSRPLSAR